MKEEQANGITKRIYEKSDHELRQEIVSLISGISKAMNGQTQRRFIIPDGVNPEKMSIYHAIDIIQEAAFKEQCGQRRAKAIQAFVDRVERLDEDLEEIRSYAQ